MAPKPNPENMVTVRTTFRPDEEVEMDRREAEDLRRQGLLVEDEKPEETTQEKPAARRAPREDAKKESE